MKKEVVQKIPITINGEVVGNLVISTSPIKGIDLYETTLRMDPVVIRDSTDWSGDGSLLWAELGGKNANHKILKLNFEIADKKYWNGWN